MSQGIEEIRQLQKSLRISRNAKAFLGNPSISRNVLAIGGEFSIFFTNLQFWETAVQQKTTFKTILG